MVIALFGIMGIAAGYLMVWLIDKLIEKKRLKTTVIEKHPCLRTKGSKAVLCILNAAVWTLTSWQAEDPVTALLMASLLSLALMIALIDLRIHIIPNELVLAMMAVGIPFQVYQFGARSLLVAVACMIGLSGLFLLTGAIIGMNKVGAGDVKLAGAMGLALGYPLILTAALAMSVGILLYCFFGVFFYKITMKSMFPYGPFLMLGLVTALGTVMAGI